MKSNFIIWALACILATATSCNKEQPTNQEAKPLPTPNISITETTRTSIAFEWAAIENASGYEYEILKGEESVASKSTDKNTLKAVAEGLTFETEYKIRVKAVTKSTLFKESEWGEILGSTKPGPTYVEFNDPVLEKYILDQNIDANGDKIIQFDEAKKLTALEIGFFFAEDATPEKTVTDITGLEYFTNLSKLELKNHNVKSATPIEKLNSLTSLNLGGNKEITTLELAGLPNLTDLRIYDTQITTLDLKSTPKLQQLYAQRSKLEELDLTLVPELEGAFLNKSTNLKKINASGLEKITKIEAVECALTDVTIENCKALTEIHLNSNKLTEIKGMKGLPMLMRLNIYDNKFKAIDLKDFPILMFCFVFNNEISEIDFSANERLREVMVSNNPMKVLDFSKNPDINSLTATNMPSLTTINLKNNFYDEWAYYEISEGNSALRKVIVDEGPEVDHMKNIFKNNPNVTISTTN